MASRKPIPVFYDDEEPCEDRAETDCLIEEWYEETLHDNPGITEDELQERFDDEFEEWHYQKLQDIEETIAQSMMD